MPELGFQVIDARPESISASPLLILKLEIANEGPQDQIQTIALRCQIQIEATRRRYSSKEQERLLDLYGEPARWGQTLKTMLWTHTNAVVGPFTNGTIIDLPVPCTFDFNVAASKYFAGLEDGEIPICLQFSGTIFYVNDSGALQVSQIPWNKEARYRLPVAIWHEMMEIYYPNGAWLFLRRDVFDRMNRYKMRRGIPTWDQTIESLLSVIDEEVPS